MHPLAIFDKASGILTPITPQSKGIILYKERKREARAIEEREKASERSQKQLFDITDFPVQINPYVVASLMDRWVIIGMSGAGKTTWVKQFIPRVRAWWGVPVYVLDSKGQDEFDDIASKLVISQAAPTDLARPGEIRVWKPPLDDYAQYDLWLGSILKGRRPCLVVIDELSSLGRGRADTYPLNYQLLLKQGRGLKICVVSMVQEVAYTPRQTTGQTSHILRFHLTNQYDIQSARRFMGISDVQRYQEPPLPYGFFYRRVDKPSPIYAFTNYQQFFQVREAA